MSISAEHRSRFAAFQRQWWCLQVSEKFSSGTQNYTHTHNKLFSFLAFLAKAHVSFSDRNLSVVVVNCRLCCRCKLFKFSYSCPEPFGQFQPNIFGWRVFKLVFFSNERPCSVSRGNNNEIANISSRILKILFYRTTGQISTKLGAKHP